MRSGLLLFFTLLCLYSSGQEYFSNTRSISTEEGLSHNKVHCFYPEVGGMWVGTADGLNFFDGFNWKTWTKDAGHLEHKAINFIHKDQANNLWLFNTASIFSKAEVRSIAILNTESDQLLSFSEKLGGQAPFTLAEIQHFFQGEQQKLYFYAQDQLWSYTPHQLFEAIPLPQGFKPFRSFSDGSFVGPKDGKIVIVSPEGNLVFTSDYALREDNYQVIGNQNRFWVYQRYGTCRQFDRQPTGLYRSTNFPIQSDRENPFALLHYNEQKKELCLRRGFNLYLCDEKGQMLYQHRMLPRVVCIDDQGNLWAAAAGITIFNLEKNNFTRYLYHDRPQVAPEEVYRCRGILAKEGKLLVNTYRGTKVVDLEQPTAIKTIQTPIKNFVVHQDRQEQLWLGNKKLYRFADMESPIRRTYNSTAKYIRIWSLYDDREGRLWIGEKGLSYLTEQGIKKFEKYNGYDELAEALILFFYTDKNGVIWVGGNTGLYQLDPQQGVIAGYGLKREGAFHLPTNKFQHMYQDATGVFWLATEDAGLLRWDKATGAIKAFDKNNGLLSNNVYAVYEDDYNTLWCSSSNGLIRFQKDSQKVRVYNIEEGICDNEFNRISHFKAADGRIFFGGQNGVTGFHPKDFLEETSPEEELALSLKHISIHGKNFLKDTFANGTTIDLLALKPDATLIDLEIESSDLFWTDRIDLHYTLIPLDEKQKSLPTFKEKISADNHIELYRMQAGNYNLAVKAVQNGGKQIGSTLIIPIRMAKPFVQTWPFWILVLLSMGIGIWGFLKLRTAHLRKKQAQLEILVAERTQQLIKNQKTIRTQEEQIEAMQVQLDRRDELWLEQFQTLIHEHLEDTSLDLNFIIDRMDISRSTFYEKVKVLTQMTPNQYIQELRLSKAKAILESGEVKTVKEVAYAVGMNQPSYFTKLFKERYGVLPSNYFRYHKN